MVVPSGCAAYQFELIYRPEIILRQRYRKLVHVSHLPRGGHFAAFEEPELFADDFLEFVGKSEALLAQEAAQALELKQRQQKEAKKNKNKNL